MSKLNFIQDKSNNNYLVIDRNNLLVLFKDDKNYCVTPESNINNNLIIDMKRISSFSTQELIDKALNEYRKGNISLDNYINVCKRNLQNDNTKEQKNLYKQDIKRNNILSFKDKEIIENLTEDEIYRKIESYLKESLQLADIDTDIIGIQLVGSRTKGINKSISDLDVLVEYNNSEIHEDDLFNYLN